MRMLIVDDHPMFRIAIREVLARQPELEVVAEAGSVADAIACLTQHTLLAGDRSVPEAASSADEKGTMP